MSKIVLSGWAYVPTSLFTPNELATLKHDLTFQARKLAPDHFPQPIQLYDDTTPDWIGVPRAWGREHFANLPMVDRMTDGEPMQPVARRPDPNHERAAPGQEGFMHMMREALTEHDEVQAIAPTGTGKCLHVDELVLMFDGTTRRTGDLQPGDWLIGPDSKPRSIKSVQDGYGPLFRIVPTKGRSWVCNADHILSLRATASDGAVVKGEVVFATVSEWTGWSATRKHLFKLWRSPVEYSGAAPFDPYLVGVWLGDGWSYGPKIWLGATKQPIVNYLLDKAQVTRAENGKNCIGYCFSSMSGFGRAIVPMLRDKHIPLPYLTACRGDRLNLLAGLCDTDGHASTGGVEITQKSARLADNIAQLARSLGFAVSTTPKVVKGVTYHRMFISGHLSDLPCLTDRMQFAARRQRKDVTNVGFTVEQAGDGPWRGIVIDGDRQYLLDDFTVTHNTVVALDTAAWLGRRTLIMVHLERIADQWIEEIQDKLGVPRERIGKVQGPLCQFRDVDFAVGILNSVAQRTYLPEFYKAFGLVIVDEAHKIGTEFFSPAIPRFPARKRLTLTATEIRKDGGHAVINSHAGPVRVRSTAEALRGDVFVLDYDCGPNFRLWGNDSKARVACLSRDFRRNQLIASQVLRAYQRGRNMLIISFSVDHLELLIEMVALLGVPREAMGQYTGEHTVKVNGKPHVYNGKVVRKKYQRAHFERIKVECQLLFATYNIFTEAIDIPRLDCGIDATPRSSATQVIGRIRRPFPGKKKPLWVTVKDVRCSISMRMFESRSRDYRETGMEIVNVK